MDIDLYKTASAKNVLNKKLTKVKTIDGTILEYDQNVNNLRISLYTSDIFNYVYIPDFKRYYFVESVSLSENGINVYECECDYLMTYKNLINQFSVKCRGITKKIITNNVIIDRTESNVLITLHTGGDNK